MATIINKATIINHNGYYYYWLDWLTIILVAIIINN